MYSPQPPPPPAIRSVELSNSTKAALQMPLKYHPTPSTPTSASPTSSRHHQRLLVTASHAPSSVSPPPTVPNPTQNSPLCHSNFFSGSRIKLASTTAATTITFSSPA